MSLALEQSQLLCIFDYRKKKLQYIQLQCCHSIPGMLIPFSWNDLWNPSTVILGIFHVINFFFVLILFLEPLHIPNPTLKSISYVSNDIWTPNLWLRGTFPSTPDTVIRLNPQPFTDGIPFTVILRLFMLSTWFCFDSICKAWLLNFKMTL